MLRVYVAGPYTKGGEADNVRKAIAAADRLMELGFYPYVPHLTHFWHLLFPHPWEYWMELDKKYLRVCDILLRLPGESRGADEEVGSATRWGIPVVYSMGELLNIALGEE